MNSGEHVVETGFLAFPAGYLLHLSLQTNAGYSLLWLHFQKRSYFFMSSGTSGDGIE